MSGDLAVESCPTYAVVDKRKKKKVSEMDQESSADIALYAVVDKAKKKSVFSPDVHKNYDENEYSTEVKCIESRVSREEEAQPTYSVLERAKTSEVVSSKNSSSFNRFGDKDKIWKTSGSFSQVWLCLVIVIFAIAILTLAFGISAGVFYSMICRLRAEISSNKSESLEVSLNEELVRSLRYELELLQNKTYNNSFQLSVKTKDIKSINMSIFNAFPVVAALNDSSSNLFELVNRLNKSIILNNENIGNVFSLIAALNNSSSNLFELVTQPNMSTILNCGLLKNRINIIENVTFGRSRFAPAHSCQVIRIFQPSSTSGYYWVRSSNGPSVHVYCDMTKPCGNVTGGLTRVAILNNETRRHLCTDDFSTTNENTRCVRSTEDAGCSNMVFPVMNISYSHICGIAQAFWFGFPDGFTGSKRSSTTLNDNYVDGISLTYGTSNKTHIWTLIADGVGSIQNCPREVPEYVGSDYSCLNEESSCTSSSSSCSSPFFSLLQQPVTEDIELRLCRDQHRVDDNEVVYLGNLEIYVW